MLAQLWQDQRLLSLSKQSVRLMST